MNETFICPYCNNECYPEEVCSVDDVVMCESCAEDRTVICECCGDRIWARDSVCDEYIALCEGCYDNYYTRCAECDRIIHLDYANYEYDGSDEPLCDSCYEKSESRVIRDYSYKPEPIFYGEGKRYFGIELEIDHAGEDCYNAKKILDIANASCENIYIKHDGSIDDGFEIVTHPMTMNYHIEKMPWQQVCKSAINMGYLSHKAGTCGLHIHVNRGSFGEDFEKQEECIGRVLFFVEKNWEELLKFSRRTQYQLSRWAARYGYKDKPGDILKHAKSRCLGRYTCVNLTNYATIEFRIFRGTLKYNTLIATLQLVNEICNVAFSMSDDEVKSLSWSGFVGNLNPKQYPELITYLKERRLYVNEPIETEEDL